jgi:hypothetical protein
MNVTLAPTVAGLRELASPVAVVAGATALITCDKGALADAALPALPLYAATIACAPTPSPEVAQAAVRLLPLPVTATALHPLILAPLAVKAIVPVGALPVTVAVNVTLAPAVAGLSELASVVVVGAGAAVFTTCDSGVLDDAPLVALPA